jgi:predicted nuclease of predicted toxin-antitoxin system
MAERLAYAAEHGYTVLTNDLDFGTILAATQGEKPSVVQIRSDNLDPDVIPSPARRPRRLRRGGSASPRMGIWCS